MARIARVVAVGTPYHVTHRGNHRSAVFFEDADRERYLALLARHARLHGIQVWACCLMTSHEHLIVVARQPQSLARAAMVARAEDYPWSGARSHVLGRSNALLSEARPFPGPVENWSDWLAMPADEEAVHTIRRNTSTGRPSGSESFVKQLEDRLHRLLRPMKAGRKPKSPDTTSSADLFQTEKRGEMR